MAPPNISWVIWRTTVSPVPEPEPNSRVVKPGSKIRSRCSLTMPTPWSWTAMCSDSPTCPRVTTTGEFRPRDRIADEVCEHLIQGVGIALEKDVAHVDDRLERDAAFTGERPLQRDARPDDLGRVEPLRAGQPAPGAVLYRAQELDRLLHALAHARQLLKQLRPEVGRQRLRRPDQVEREIEARERGRKGIGDLVGDHAGLARQLRQGVGLRQTWPVGHGRLVHETKAQTRQLEGDPLPAAALDAVGGRCGRLLPHGSDTPHPGVVQPAADPATALDNWGTPAMQRAIEVQACVRALGTPGAGQDGHHFRARRDLPEGDWSPLQGHARFAQNFATVLLHLGGQMWEAERPGPRAFLRHEGVRMRQLRSLRQPSPLRRRFPSFSRSALRPATMTRSRPSFFAWYIAASALAISSSGVSPCVGYSAAPTLTVTRPPPNSSAATRARRRSPTAAAVAIGASISMTRNSSPP